MKWWRNNVSATTQLHLVTLWVSFTSPWLVVLLSWMMLMFLQNFQLAIDLLASAQFILCLRGQTLSLIPRKKPHGHFCFDWGREVMGSWMDWVSLVLGINSTDSANTFSERGLFLKSMICDSSLQCIKHPSHTSITNLLSEYVKESLWPGNVLLDLLYSVRLIGHLYQNPTQSLESGHGQDQGSTGSQFKSETRN